MTAKEVRNKIIDYLDKQFWKHKQYEQMPENDTGYEYVPREALVKIVDGLIPLMKPYVNEQYASTKAEEVKEISVAFAIHMKKDILMLSDLKDNSRWNKMFDEWYNQYKLSQI